MLRSENTKICPVTMANEYVREAKALGVAFTMVICFDMWGVESLRILNQPVFSNTTTKHLKTSYEMESNPAHYVCSGIIAFAMLGVQQNQHNMFNYQIGWRTSSILQHYTKTLKEYATLASRLNLINGHPR